MERKSSHYLGKKEKKSTRYYGKSSPATPVTLGLWSLTRGGGKPVRGGWGAARGRLA
jgi:hypothetical protein